MGQIQDLIDEGVLVLYHDYRAGHMLDLSGNGNDGVPTNVTWGGGGVQFVANTSVITVADSPELQSTTGTLVVLTKPIPIQPSFGRMIAKEDAGGRMYDWFLSAVPYVGVQDTPANTRTTNIAVPGAKYIAMNYTTGAAPDGYVDGLFSGAYNLAVTITADNADIVIGNAYIPTASGRFPGVMLAAMIVNRPLTATEHAQLYAELESLKWPQKRKVFAKASATVPQTQFKTDYGGKVVAAVGAAAQIPGTNYYVNSGNFNLIMDTIDSQDVKAIECGASGGFQVQNVEMQGDPGDDALDCTWTFGVNKVAASTYTVNFVSDDLAGTNGYSFNISATEVISLTENGVGDLFTSAAGYVLADTWYVVTITRSAAGEFTVYIDGTAVVAATGTNPVTDNTVTESTYFVLDIDTGDKFSHSSVNGNYGFIKQAGVNAP
jgi:hypothetical protein